MKDNVTVKLDEYEFRAVVNLINEKRNNMLKQKQNAEFITEILEKVIDSPTNKKCILKRERETCAR